MEDSEAYVLITVAKQNFSWEGRILSRGIPYLPVRVSLPMRMKSNTKVRVGDVSLVRMTDADNGEGTADIIEIIEGKDIRKLRHKKLIPEEEEYQDLLVSDKKLGYTGGAFPYKAKISGLGASTMPEDEDVIARAKAAEKAARRAARKAANNGVSPAESPSTSPSTSPAMAPAPTAEPIPPMAELPSNNMSSPPRCTSSSSEEDEGEESDVCDETHAEAEEENDLADINPNHARWIHHDGGVSKGYVSKRERRDLAMETRLKKRSEAAPKQSPSLIPQMAALDRIGGDADLDAI